MAEKKKKTVKGTMAAPRPRKTSEPKGVELTHFAPWAREVCITGEFNAWEIGSTPMKKDESGTWRARLKLLPGRYEYKLCADGCWVEDLPGAEPVPNPFGTRNFVLWVI